MYKTDYICTYMDDDVFVETDKVNDSEKDFIRNCIYRQDLLNIFGLNEFKESVINKKINDLNEIEMKKAPKEIHLLPLITGSGWAVVIAVVVAVVTATATYLLTPAPVVPGATGTSKSIKSNKLKVAI